MQTTLSRNFFTFEPLRPFLNRLGQRWPFQPWPFQPWPFQPWPFQPWTLALALPALDLSLGPSSLGPSSLDPSSLGLADLDLANLGPASLGFIIGSVSLNYAYKTPILNFHGRQGPYSQHYSFFLT